MQDAFEEAVKAWPRDGVPAKPGAWITTAARRRAIDRLRRNRSLLGRAERLAELMQPERGGRAHDRRRPAAADLHVLPPGAGDAGARRAHAAHARRPDHRGDRSRVPRRRADDGQADRAREAQDRRRAHPVSGARGRRAPRPPARRAPGRLPDLQRGLRGRRGRSAGARGAVRRGDPTRRAADAADARRPRGLGALGADAAARRAPGRARGRERAVRRAGCPGPVAVGSGPDPRRAREARAGARDAAPGRVPAAGRDLGRADPGPGELGADRRALRRPRGPQPLTGDRAQSRGGRRDGVRARRRPRTARAAAGGELERYQPLHAAHADLLSRAGDAEGAARAYERAIELSANDVEREELERRRATLR